MQPEQTIQSPYAARAGIIVNIPGLREIFGIDLRTLALFRVGLGALLLVDLALRARDLTAHYTDAGILPRAALLDTLSVGSFSLHLLNGTVAFQAVMFIIAAVFALIFIHEPMTVWKITGGAIIVVGNLACELLQKRKPPPQVTASAMS